VTQFCRRLPTLLFGYCPAFVRNDLARISRNIAAGLRRVSWFVLIFGRDHADSAVRSQPDASPTRCFPNPVLGGQALWNVDARGYQRFEPMAPPNNNCFSLLRPNSLQILGGFIGCGATRRDDLVSAAAGNGRCSGPAMGGRQARYFNTKRTNNQEGTRRKVFPVNCALTFGRGVPRDEPACLLREASWFLCLRVEDLLTCLRWIARASACTTPWRPTCSGYLPTAPIVRREDRESGCTWSLRRQPASWRNPAPGTPAHRIRPAADRRPSAVSSPRSAGRSGTCRSSTSGR
jgi:hypothetical protein